MEGNIEFVDYELSSWKYQEKEYEPSPYAKYISGELLLPENSGIIIKRGFVLPGTKGMGSAYGAKWKPNPNKPNDMAFIGPPNSIQRMYISTSKGGYWIQAKYGDDGWAVAIRHETNHGNGGTHTDPHDHIPAYDPNTHAPLWNESQEINYPDGAPEFKSRERRMIMDISEPIILHYDKEALRFKTISEFKDCMKRGGEVVFDWNGIEYGTFRLPPSMRTETEKYIIAQSGTIETNRATELRCATPDDILEYMVGGDRLRDVITKVSVVERSF